MISISAFLILFVNLMFYITRVSPVSAQVVLCDIAGCENGDCLEPPQVAQPTCSCSTGFRSYTDTNICEDIDECSLDPFRCGYSYTDHTYHFNSYKTFLYSGYPQYPQYPQYLPFVPSGRCVNTQGSYYCLCYPPNRSVNNAASCIYPPRRQRRPYNNILALRLLDEL